MISSQNNSRQNGFTTAFLLLVVAMSLWIGFKIMRLATANPANQFDVRIAMSFVGSSDWDKGGTDLLDGGGGGELEDVEVEDIDIDIDIDIEDVEVEDIDIDIDIDIDVEDIDVEDIDDKDDKGVDDKGVDDKGVDDRGVDDRGGEIIFPVPPVITSFVASPNPIIRGQTSQLTWTSTNANFCNGVCVSGDCNDWTGTNKPANGSQNVSPRTTATYELTCIGFGGSDTERTTIEVRTVRWREVIPRLLPFLNRVLLGMSE